MRAMDCRPLHQMDKCAVAPLTSRTPSRQVDRLQVPIYFLHAEQIRPESRLRRFRRRGGFARFDLPAVNEAPSPSGSA
jgi:hypothetical protein